MGRLVVQLPKFGEMFDGNLVRSLMRQLEDTFKLISVDRTTPQTNVTATTYTPTISDSLIYCDTSSNNITVTLPASTETAVNDKLTFIVKKAASANTLTILPTGSDTLDGATGIVLYNRGSAIDFRAVSGGWVAI